jgi:hypothetical protein
MTFFKLTNVIDNNWVLNVLDIFKLRNVICDNEFIYKKIILGILINIHQTTYYHR